MDYQYYPQIFKDDKFCNPLQFLYNSAAQPLKNRIDNYGSQ